MQHGLVACRVWCRYLQRTLPACTPRRGLSSSCPRRVELSVEDAQASIEKTRNIGIIAHIDAVYLSFENLDFHLELTCHKGKTTTTERMLYYSGHTRRIGSM